MSQISQDLQNVELYTGSLSTNERHKLLEAERRRQVLTALDGQTDALELEGLATSVLRLEHDRIATDDEIEQVAIALHHIHLPTMDELGVLDYDPETNEVEPVTAFTFE